MSRLLFTYGALTNSSVMADRCPSSESVGRADLLDYKMVFRSVADIERVEGGVVFGVLWRISNYCERSLDLYETPKYIKRTVTVRHDELGQLEAIVYLMSGRDSQESPRAVYRDTIAEGYREHDISVKQLNMAVREAEREHRKEIGNIRKGELDY